MSIDFGYLDELWNEAPEATVGGTVPDGDYQLRLQSVEIAQSQQGNTMLRQELEVFGGDYDGRTIFRNNVMATAQNMGFLKHDLKMYGIDIDDPSFSLGQFLNSGLGLLLDRVVDASIKTKTGQQYPNVYLNGYIGIVDENGELIPAEGEVDEPAQAATPAPVRQGTARPMPRSTRAGAPAGGNGQRAARTPRAAAAADPFAAE